MVLEYKKGSLIKCPKITIYNKFPFVTQIPRSKVAFKSILKRVASSHKNSTRTDAFLYEIRKFEQNFLKNLFGAVWCCVWHTDDSRFEEKRWFFTRHAHNAGQHCLELEGVRSTYDQARTDSHTRQRSPRPSWSPLDYIPGLRSRAQPAQQLQSRSLPSASWNAVVPLYTDTIHRLSHSLPAESRTQQCLWHKKYYNIWRGGDYTVIPRGFFPLFFPLFFRLTVEFSRLSPCTYARCLAWQLRRSAQSSRKEAAPYRTLVEFVLDVAKIRRIREPAVFVTGASRPWRSGRMHRVYAGASGRTGRVQWLVVSAREHGEVAVRGHDFL